MTIVVFLVGILFCCCDNFAAATTIGAVIVVVAVVVVVVDIDVDVDEDDADDGDNSNNGSNGDDNDDGEGLVVCSSYSKCTMLYSCGEGH